MPHLFLEDDGETLSALSEVELDVVSGGINPQPLPPFHQEDGSDGPG
jgi:hypothetical protein